MDRSKWNAERVTLISNYRCRPSRENKYQLYMENSQLGKLVREMGALRCKRSLHSHSIVAGGLELTSYVTRLIPRTSLMIRLETFFSKA